MLRYLVLLALAPACSSALRPASGPPVPVAAADCPAAASTPEPADSPKTPVSSPGEHGLLAYPVDEASPFPDGWAEVVPLSPDDVAPTFDNLDDLAWLVPIARDNKVVLLGENHYFRVTHHLAHRVLFALQQGDHFHLLSLELPYSLTPYLDHYVQLADDGAAAAFAGEAFPGRVNTAELRALLDHVRAWNKRHPQRAIHLAAHDIEHDVRGAIGNVLAPYFRGLEPGADLEVEEFVNDPDGFFARLDRLVARARKARRVGVYPFLTAEFVAGVVENLRSAHHARAYDHNHYRQRALVRNLTDERYLGPWLRRGKVMIWGGSYHTPSRLRFPGDGAFLREGAYLEQEFAPTRGRTYSIQAIGLAYTLDAMADVDVATLGHMGDSYRSSLTRMQAAYRAGAIARDDAYFSWTPPAIAAGALALARTVDHRPYRITRLSWEALQGLPVEVQRAAREVRAEIEGHDAVIVVPRSPLVRQLPPG